MADFNKAGEHEEEIKYFRELYLKGELVDYCTQLLNKVSADAKKQKDLYLSECKDLYLSDWAQEGVVYRKFKYPFEFELWRTFNQNRIA